MKGRARRDWLRWGGWAALSFPVAVLSHEIAHYAAYHAFSFPSPTLHYGSAGYSGDDRFWDMVRAGDLTGAAVIVQPWQAGAAAAAGIAATYLTILACVWLVRRKPHPFLFGLGLVAPLRFLGSAMLVAGMLFGKFGSNGSDENHAAIIFSVSEFLLQLMGVVVLVVSWIALLRSVPQPERRSRISALVGGVVLGGAAYILVLGPLLLP